MYQPMEHPRWGAINGIETIAEIPAGKEVYTYYRYEDNKHLHSINLDWYWELKRKTEKEERLKAKQLKAVS